VYLGCNLEFRGLGLHHCIHAGLSHVLVLPWICKSRGNLSWKLVKDRDKFSWAEEFALISALNHGESRVVQLAVSAAPCGYCRQILAEAVCIRSAGDTAGGQMQEGDGNSLGGQGLEVFVRPNPISFSIIHLLPMPFGPRDMGETGGLFTQQHHSLVFIEMLQDQDMAGVWGRLAKTALDCAVRSYSPYSHSPAGVALLTHACDTSAPHQPSARVLEDSAGECSEVVCGSYYENCAFNPSTSPAKSALVAAVCAQRAFAAISHVVLVELEGAAVSHAHETRALIASLSPLAQVRVIYAKKT